MINNNNILKYKFSWSQKNFSQYPLSTGTTYYSSANDVQQQFPGNAK